jgi:hypothetical protein
VAQTQISAEELLGRQRPGHEVEKMPCGKSPLAIPAVPTVALVDPAKGAEAAGTNIACSRADPQGPLAASSGRGGAALEDLLASLVRWGTADGRTVIAAAAVEAASFLRLSQAIGPALQELLRCSAALALEGEPNSRLVDQYLTISSQGCALLGVLDSVRRR